MKIRIDSDSHFSADELRAAFAKLPCPDDPPDPHTWPRHLYSFHKHLESGDPKEFLTWSTMHAVMFVGNAPFVHDEVEALRNDSKGWLRWRNAIREDSFGAPDRLPWMVETSGNMVHQAYHLLQWERTADIEVNQLGTIVEFGGGYGAMARLIHRLGFKGEYLIYDQPELIAIQRFYLSNVKVPATLLITDSHEFPSPPKADLLISCYSLGEVPRLLRDAFLEFPFRSYLIASQDTYHKENLHDYFDTFSRSRSELSWSSWWNPVLPGHRYWIGR